MRTEYFMGLLPILKIKCAPEVGESGAPQRQPIFIPVFRM